MTGPELRAWMRHRGYSLTTLADALGVTSRTVQRWRDAGTTTLVDLALGAIDPKGPRHD